VYNHRFTPRFSPPFTGPTYLPAQVTKNFIPTYVIGGAKSSELLALVGITPIRESLFQCGEANCKSLILFIEYVISSAYCIFWVHGLRLLWIKIDLEAVGQIIQTQRTRCKRARVAGADLGAFGVMIRAARANQRSDTKGAKADRQMVKELEK